MIAAFGAGTMPVEMAELARQMAEEGCVIIVSSRVGEVVVQPETMTAPGAGLLPSGILNPAKSAVLLSLALAEGLSAAGVAEMLGQLGGEAPGEA